MWMSVDQINSDLFGPLAVLPLLEGALVRLVRNRFHPLQRHSSQLVETSSIQVIRCETERFVTLNVVVLQFDGF